MPSEEQVAPQETTGDRPPKKRRAPGKAKKPLPEWRCSFPGLKEAVVKSRTQRGAQMKYKELVNQGAKPGDEPLKQHSLNVKAHRVEPTT